MTKTNAGRFFEDYTLGDVIRHAVPRTVAEGERALYTALYPQRFALHSSDAFALWSGLDGSPMDDLITFHVVFGKTVADISLTDLASLIDKALVQRIPANRRRAGLAGAGCAARRRTEAAGAGGALAGR